MLYYSKTIVRILRLNRIISVKGRDDVVFFVYGNIIYKLEIKEDKCIQFSEIDVGKKALKITYIENSDDFEEGIYYGEYFSNPQKMHCSIYHIDIKGNKRCVYTFKEGMINHIHLLLEDKINNCVWIFTGDFENAAAIWKATYNFQVVEPILCGSQEYRACVAFYDFDHKRIVYATDTPLEKNTLRSLSCVDGRWVSSMLHNINGSVIYGFETSKYLFFSSTVESNGIYKNKFDVLTSRNKGDGIKDYYTYLYRFDKKSQELEILFKQKKDLLPFVFFQFGTMTFPAGSWNRDIVPILCVATQKNDLKTLFIKNNS